MCQNGTARWEGPPGAKARGHAIGFLSARQSALLQPPNASTTEGRAVPYACPRSLEAAVRLRAETDNVDYADMLTEAALGPGVTTEFCAWLREADLPDPEDVIASAQTWEPYAGRADRTLAVLLGVVGAVVANVSTSRYAAAAHVLVSAAKAGHAGVALVCGRYLMQSDQIVLLEEPCAIGELERLVDADLR